LVFLIYKEIKIEIWIRISNEEETQNFFYFSKCFFFVARTVYRCYQKMQEIFYSREKINLELPF